MVICTGILILGTYETVEFILRKLITEAETLKAV